VPSVRQTFVRMLPTCAVLVFGIPIAALVIQTGAGQDDRSSWTPLLYLSVVALMLIVYRITRAPRPRQDIEVEGAQRRRALTAASQIGEVSTDPAVRKSTGVLACERIEIFALMVAVLIGVIAGIVVHPVPGWGVVWGPALVVGIAGAFHLRSSIAYLRALRLAPQTN
jgi:hypothetical protein